MADNYLITGYWGEPHVTAENHRGINAAVFGAGKFVLPVGEMFRAEYIGNNTVRIYDGKLMDNGAAAGIPAGKYIDLLIPEAGQGMNRNDLIIFQYSQDASTLIESGVFTVLRGTETSETAADPLLHEEDLLTDEAALDQMALWRVPVSGANISEPVQLFRVSKRISDIEAINVLVNGDFTNPVNRRGATSYTGSKEGIDKWISRSGYCTVTIKEDCVNIKSTNGTTAAYVLQLIEPEKIKSGKKHTAVCQLKDGSIHTVTSELSVGMTEETKYIYVDGEQLGTIRLRYDSSESMYAVMFSTLSTDGMDIVNVALYEGEYTENTLPAFHPRGYSVEATLCGALSMELLWKNASTESNFASQTVALDLSEYDFVSVVFAVQTSANTHVATGFVRVGGGIHAEEYTTNSGSINKRQFKATTTGVNFENGRQGSTTGESYMIPAEIYGIRGAIV